MIKKLFLFHLVPFTLAGLLICGALIWISACTATYCGSTYIISGEQVRTKGVYDNLIYGDQAELDFIASLKNKNQLTIFGSSEFTDAPLCSYNFLPDSLGIQSLGIGHAHHQCFSILCELLAASEYVAKSKICIVLSPSWFHTYGTNTEAFAEFVRPHFIEKIVHEKSIDNKYKIAIGKYIHEHRNEFTGISNGMAFLKDEYCLAEGNWLDFINASLHKKLVSMHQNSFPIQNIIYQPKLKNMERKEWVADKNKTMQGLQQTFLASITTNKLYVNDEYYNLYVKDADGIEAIGEIKEIDFDNNQELEDFKLLVDLLVKKNANCSFVIQPINPYYYQYADRNIPLIDTLTKILDKHNLPYLNMYAPTKEAYDPGVLKDVMHLGDYGWMKINYFLDSLYYEHQ